MAVILLIICAPDGLAIVRRDYLVRLGQVLCSTCLAGDGLAQAANVFSCTCAGPCGMLARGGAELLAILLMQ